jgi:hypothetical protein
MEKFVHLDLFYQLNIFHSAGASLRSAVLPEMPLVSILHTVYMLVALGEAPLVAARRLEWRIQENGRTLVFRFLVQEYKRFTW